MNYLKITIATLIFVMSFAMQSNEAEAQSDCEFGYSYYSFTVTYPCTECIYHIEFCYKCTAAGPSSGNSVVDINYEPLNPESGDCPSEDIIDWVIGIISDKWFDLCTIPPCDQDSVVYTTEIPLCVKTRNVAWIDDEGNPQHYTFQQSCIDTDNYCEETWKVCFDIISGKYVQKIYETKQKGTDTCLDSIQVSIPPIGNTWNDNWDTDCYFKPSRVDSCNKYSR